VSERERIQALEAKLKQLKTLQARREARARTTAAKKSRGEELRRRILAGAVLLAKVEEGEFEEERLKQWMETSDLVVPLADGSRRLTSPRISFGNIFGLFVGGVIASIVAFAVASLFGLSLHLTVLFSTGASSVWWIARYYRRSRRLGWDPLRTRFAAIDRKLMLASVAGALALSLFPDVAIWILRGAGIKIADIPTDAIVPSGIEQLPLTILFLVILAPFAEELMFRGLLLDWLKQKLAAWQAILISSLIFALLHDNHLTTGLAGWIELADRFLMGVGASILALRGHSLRGPSVMHAAGNIIVCITSALPEA